MRKPTLLLAGAIALFIAGALFSATNNAFGSIVVTPFEADVNKSGTVNAIDLQQVAQKFGMPVPTATAAVTPTTYWVTGVRPLCDGGNPDGWRR